MKQTIRIKLIEGCANKLMFVKLLKDCSGLGLKESKDICDRLHSHPQYTQSFEVRQDNTGVNYARKFRDEVVNCGGKFVIGGRTEFMRDLKSLI